MYPWGVRQTGDELESVELYDHQLGSWARVAPGRGGMVTRFSVGGEPVLRLDEATLKDPKANVRGGVPTLFPFAGRLADDTFTSGGGRYAMGQHGFGRNLPWVRRRAGADFRRAYVELELRDGEATHGVFPFEFTATLRYALRGPTLQLRLSIENRGAAPMPVAPGFHPYFFVAPGTKAACRVGTDATLALETLTGRQVKLDPVLALDADEVNLQLLDHRLRDGSHGVSQLVRPGLRTVTLSFTPGVLTVWSLGPQDFVCVEPWHGPSNALNVSPAWVEPGGTYVFELSMTAAGRSRA